MAKTIAFHLQKGGVGKTTISGTLACQSALDGYKTLLIDVDPQGNASSWFLKKTPKYELADVVLSTEDELMGVVVDEVLLVTILFGILVEELMVSCIDAYLFNGRVLYAQSQKGRRVLAYLLAICELRECIVWIFSLSLSEFVHFAFVLKIHFCTELVLG